MESDIFWDLELFLLDPSSKFNQNLSTEIKNKLNSYHYESNIPNFDKFNERFSEILDFLVFVKNVDIYRGILALDRLIGNPTFILDTPKVYSLNHPSDLYSYLSDSFSKYFENRSKSEHKLDSLFILGASVLFLNVFVRINWVGPPFSLSYESDRVLSEKYQNKVVEDEFDNVDILNESLVNMIDSLDLNKTRSSFLLDKIHKEFSDKCILTSPELSLINTNIPDKCSGLLKSILEEFVVDGESVYYGVFGIQYLYASLVLIRILDNYLENERDYLKSLEIWRTRVAYIWQLVVEDSSNTPCPTLFNCNIFNYINLLKDSQVLNPEFSLSQCDPDLLDVVKIDYFKTDSNSSKICNVVSNFKSYKMDFPDQLKSFLLLELLQRLPLYNLNRLYDSIYKKLSQYLDFSFEFTGKLGVRRKHQKKSIPQLIVDYKKAINDANLLNRENNNNKEINNNSDRNNTTIKSTNIDNKNEDKDENKSIENQINISLDEIYGESDILETPKLDSKDNLETLSELEQLFLLSKGFNVLATTPQNDQLGLEFINAIATTCLQEDPKEQKNWLITCTSLWLRCKTEYNRTKTIERATLQLHSISDSFYEHNPPNRIEYFFGIGFPSRWNIKREIAKHMFYIGSFSTAFEIYKQLHLWEDAIKCLLVSDRKNEAKELVYQRLKIMPTPQLYCYLGDIENDASHYETAWKLSGEKSARAMRSLGVKSFNSGMFDDAIRYLERSLVLNPMNEYTQFLLGCCYLKSSKFSSALNCFSRVVSLNPDSSDAWANISSCHVNLNNMPSGKVAILQAIKNNNTRWQFWDIAMRIAVSTQDVQLTCKSVESLLELGKKEVIENWVVAFLVDASTRVNENLSNLVDQTLKNIVKNVTENADLWSIYSKYLGFKKDYVGALESAFKQYRKVEQDILANLTEKKDTEELQMEFDVSLVKKLTNALSSMVILLKRMNSNDRIEHRESVIEALKISKTRVQSRTPKVNEQFSKEVDLLIESAEVEDVESLKRGFERHGDIEVYAFQNCENDNGWAFIGYSSRTSVKKLMKYIYRKNKRKS